MLTKADIKWLKHLSNSKKVKIVPYNPKVKKVFEKQKKEILDILETNIEVLHLGATGMSISGQGEIDLVIPVSLGRFDEVMEKIKKVYGEPRSFYPNNRARFHHRQDSIDIEIVVINQDSKGWKRNIAFENYLKKHPEALEAYRTLKESNDGIGTRDYYRKKIEFINDILEKALSQDNKVDI